MVDHYFVMLGHAVQCNQCSSCVLLCLVRHAVVHHALQRGDDRVITQHCVASWVEERNLLEYLGTCTLTVSMYTLSVNFIIGPGIHWISCGEEPKLQNAESMWAV